MGFFSIYDCFQQSERSHAPLLRSQNFLRRGSWIVRLPLCCVFLVSRWFWSRTATSSASGLLKFNRFLLILIDSNGLWSERTVKYLPINQCCQYWIASLIAGYSRWIAFFLAFHNLHSRSFRVVASHSSYFLGVRNRLSPLGYLLLVSRRLSRSCIWLVSIWILLFLWFSIASVHFVLWRLSSLGPPFLWELGEIRRN